VVKMVSLSSWGRVSYWCSIITTGIQRTARRHMTMDGQRTTVDGGIDIGKQRISGHEGRPATMLVKYILILSGA